MTILGLDYGMRRTGVAVGDTEAKFAHGVETIDPTDWKTQLGRLILEHEVAEIVVGLPRGLEGQETAQTTKAREFAAEVGTAFGLPVHLQDEAGTSELAVEHLAGSKHRLPKGAIDAEAAAIILQDYLDGLK